MTLRRQMNHVLQNQSLVQFNLAGVEQVAYSNKVVTPLVGPLLTVSKSASVSQASLGQVITYSLTIYNGGNKKTDIKLYDPLPEGTAFIANSVLRDGVPLPGAQPASGIPLGTLEVHRSIQVIFQLIVVSIPASLQLINQAEAAYEFDTEDGRTITGSVQSNVMEISIKAFLIAGSLQTNTNYTFIGDIVTYSITVVNEGNLAVQDVLLRMSIPPGMLYVPGSVLVDQIYTPYNDPGHGIIIGVLAPGASAQAEFRLQVISEPSPPFFISTAVVDYIAGTEPLTYETNPVEVLVVGPEITITESVNRSVATLGDTLVYAIRVQNNGNSAVDALLALNIPAGTLFVRDSIRVNGNLLNGASPREPIPLGVLTARSFQTVSFQVKIPETGYPDTLPVVRNQSKLQFTFRLPDGRQVQNTEQSNAVETSMVAPIFQLYVFVEPTVIYAGDPVEFTVRLVNAGNYAADATIHGLIPPGTEWISRLTVHSLDQSVVPSNGSRHVGQVLPQSEAAFSYTLQINSGAYVKKGYMNAEYRYTLNDEEYTGQVSSNEYSIIVEDYIE